MRALFRAVLTLLIALPIFLIFGVLRALHGRRAATPRAQDSGVRLRWQSLGGLNCDWHAMSTGSLNTET
jgi:hypothetical protein